MRNTALDVNRLFVELLQSLVVLHLGMHLNLQRIDLQQLSPLLLIFFSLVGLKIVEYICQEILGYLARTAQLLQDLFQFVKFTLIEVELA